MPPVTAAVSNTLGVIPGSISGAIGYRTELSGQSRRILKLSLTQDLGRPGQATGCGAVWE